MPKAKRTLLSLPPFPRLSRSSDREVFFFSIFIFVSLAVAGVLVVLGTRIDREAAYKSLHVDAPFELKMRSIVSDYPIARMMPDILSQDRLVATYLVAIAKKESNWGKKSPQKEGRSCFNYWGYRGSEDTTDSGYSCFSSHSEAVRVVGTRIRALLDQGIDVPREFVVWKRGFVDRPLDVEEEKWVSDVSHYVFKLSKWSGGN